jgi:hypothetical protein
MKKPDISRILMPFDAASPFTQLADQAANTRRYQLYRGWVYAAVNALAAEAAGQPVTLGRVSSKSKKGKPRSEKGYVKVPSFYRTKQADDEVEIIYEHPLLDALEPPNPIQGLWQYVYSYVANLCLTGWSFIVIDDQGKDGRDYYSIPTTWIRPDHSEGAFSKFRIINPQNPASELNGEPLDRSQVMFATLPNPADPMGALSPSTATSQAISIDDQIQTSQAAFFENGIFPSVIVTMGSNPHPDVPAGIRPRLTSEQRRQVYGAIKKVSSGVANYGNPAIIDGMIEKIERLSASQNEMGWEKSEKAVRTRILSAYGVHPFILGEEMPGSYAQANIVEGRFYKKVNTYLKMLSDLHTAHARQHDDDSILMWWEPCKAVDPGMERSAWESARNRGDVRQNEYRAEVMGLPPDPDETEELIDKGMTKDVLAVAQGVRAGTIEKEQGVAILVGIGMPEKMARKIAGEAAPPPPAPPAVAPGIPGAPVAGAVAPQAATNEPTGDDMQQAVKTLDRLIGICELDPDDEVDRIMRKSSVHAQEK